MAIREPIRGIISPYLETKILNHLLANTPYVAPTQVFIALYTFLNPEIRPDGEEVAKYIGNSRNPADRPTGYERIIAPDFTITSSGCAVLSTKATFPEATEDWGEIYYIGIMDAYTGGNTLFFGPTSRPITIEKGETFELYTFSINLMEYGKTSKKTGNFTSWSASSILNHVLNNNNFPTPGTDVWMGLGPSLNISLPSKNATLNELSKTGYARQKISGSGWGEPTYRALTSAHLTNTIDVLFSNSIPVDWENIKYFALYNSQTSGSIILWGTVNPMFLVVTDGLKFSKDRIKVTLT